MPPVPAPSQPTPAPSQPITTPGQPPFGSVSRIWRIDPSESAATFVAATAWGRIPVTGRFGAVSGTLTWDGQSGSGQMAIATRGLSSGLKLRDHHLRSPAFFHVHEHPELTFEATEVRADGDTVRLRGELVVRGHRHGFECTATTSGVGSQRIALDANAEFDLDELGMSRGMLHMIRATVTAKVHVVLEPELA